MKHLSGTRNMDIKPVRTGSKMKVKHYIIYAKMRDYIIIVNKSKISNVSRETYELVNIHKKEGKMI